MGVEFGLQARAELTAYLRWAGPADAKASYGSGERGTQGLAG